MSHKRNGGLQEKIGQNYLTVNQVVTAVPQRPLKKKVTHIYQWPPTEAKFDFKPNYKSRIKTLFTLQTTPVVAPKERVWRCVLQHGNHLSFQVVATVSVAS